MAKLVRDRSTPEKDAWWRAVQQAASMAPKLTYEREGGIMDDVLERSDKWLANESKENIPFLIAALAAEVRALRKDRERAKPEIEKAVELIQRWGCECEPQIGFTCGPCRVVEIIDAAMSREGEA